MQDRHVPFLGPQYWTVLVLASIAGANMGDFVAEYLALGHVKGLPVLGLVLAAVLIAERRDNGFHTGWYWLAIVVIRTAATNLADFLTVDLRFGQLWTIAGLSVLLFAVFPMARSEVRLFMSAVLIARAGEKGRPTTDFSYWLTMIVASTLGTVLGDWCTFGLGLGALKSSVVLSLVLSMVFALHLRRPFPRLLLYWITIVAVRAACTAIGDVLARDPHLHLGLALSTALTFAAVVVFAWLWRARSSERTPS
jgi:uncharacterized membrane-anchored protein